MIWLIILGWIFLGFIGAGLFYAYFQGEYPDISDPREDAGLGLFMGLLLGPFWLIVSIFMSGFARHGWWFWIR